MKEFRNEPDEDAPGATEEQVSRIGTIRGSEVLGYEGGPREEHSGQETGDRDETLTGDLADNRPDKGDC